MPSDDSTNPFRPDRDRGVLTAADREYLADKDTLDGQGERMARQRIRNRIHEALFDLRYLADPEYLEDRDLEQITQVEDASDGRVVHGSDYPGSERLVLDPVVDEALPELVAFAYRVAPSGIEHTVQEGVQHALNRLSPEAEVGDVKIAIEDPETIAERAEARIESGARLSETELRVALEREIHPDEEIAAHVREHGVREKTASSLDEVVEWLG